MYDLKHHLYLNFVVQEIVMIQYLKVGNSNGGLERPSQLQEILIDVFVVVKNLLIQALRLALYYPISTRCYKSFKEMYG